MIRRHPYPVKHASNPDVTDLNTVHVLQTLDNMESSLEGIHKIINQIQHQVQKLSDRITALEHVLTKRNSTEDKTK